MQSGGVPAVGLCVPYRPYGRETTPTLSIPAPSARDANNVRPVVIDTDVTTELLNWACGVIRQTMRSDVDRMRCPALLMCLDKQQGHLTVDRELSRCHD